MRSVTIALRVGKIVGPRELEALLHAVQRGDATIADAQRALAGLHDETLAQAHAPAFAHIDHHRALRQGMTEVIYGAGKTHAHIAEIARALLERGDNVLCTRVDATALEAIREAHLLAREHAVHHPSARCLTVTHKPPTPLGSIAIVCAGTSDLPVADEAQVTCEAFGITVQRFTDVGVAGLQRLAAVLPRLREAQAIIVVAGMEGALASVVGGQVSCPVIAVPTSVGYGASFQVLAALLGMLTSCASGIVVVNIDNGFGAAAAVRRMLAAKHGA